jgi:hypothetical protein
VLVGSFFTSARIALSPSADASQFSIDARYAKMGPARASWVDIAWDALPAAEAKGRFHVLNSAQFAGRAWARLHTLWSGLHIQDAIVGLNGDSAFSRT